MVNIKAVNMKEVVKNFEHYIRNAGKLPMDSIAARGHKNVIKHFDDQMGPNGKWRMPKPATLRARAKRSANKEKSSSILALVDTGMLRNSILFKSLNNEAHIYTNIKYAKYHNPMDGTPPGKGIIPERKFLWITPSVKGGLKKMIINFILGKYSSGI